MYEPGNEWREFAGDSRDEAVAKAVAFFKVGSAEDLKVTDVDAEVFGLGGRTAVIAVPATASPPQRSERGAEAREPREEGRRERPRRRDDDERPRRGRERNRDRERGRTRREPEATVEQAPVELRALGKSSAKSELSEVGEFVQGLLERMRLGDFEIGESAEDDKLIALEISGEITEGLVRGGERTMEAVQLLANQAAMRIGDGDGPRIVIDVEGERSKREELLERVADRAGRRATTTGRPVALEPMNAKDRRIIHVALREAEGIATMSVGEGRYRQVVVVPEAAPEYEEAQGYEGTSRSD